MTDVAFIYRYYNNGGCDHSSPANDTFPANGASALSGGSGQCLSPPPSSVANWTTVEFNMNASAAVSVSELVVFCGADCSGTGSVQAFGDACVAAPSGCGIGSFFVLSLDSGTAGGATATLTDPNPVTTVLATTTLKGATSTSTQTQVGSAPRKDAGNTWEIVAGVLLAVTALCCLVLMAYCWRRRRNAKRKTGGLLSGGVRGHAFEDGADFSSRGDN